MENIIKEIEEVYQKSLEYIQQHVPKGFELVDRFEKITSGYYLSYPNLHALDVALHQPAERGDGKRLLLKSLGY